MKKLVPAFQFLGIGFYVAACIVGGILLGWWLGDKKPLWVIVGLVVGLIVAFYGMYGMVKPLINKKNDKENS
jgi:hypothetical protein